jgi:hypothetical protein
MKKSTTIPEEGSGVGAELPQARPLTMLVAASFRNDDLVPASGIYEVRHALHTLPKEVALFKGECFPSCSNCHSAVFFTMIRPIPAVDFITNLQIRVSLPRLPSLDKTPA